MPVNSANPLQVTIYPTNEVPSSSTGQFWSGDAPTFKDVLDMINPLQHIPGVSSIYQSLTGDVPSSGANIIGSTIVGGPIGLLSAIVNEIVKTQTGKDIGANMLAMVTGESSESSAQVASNDAPNYAPSPVNKAAYNAYMQAQTMAA